MNEKNILELDGQLSLEDFRTVHTSRGGCDVYVKRQRDTYIPLEKPILMGVRSVRVSLVTIGCRTHHVQSAEVAEK